MGLMGSFLHTGRRGVIGLTALATMAGCSGATGSGATPTPVSTATATTAAPSATTRPSDTPLPTLTATITVTPTPSILTVTSKEGDVPCRFGPGSKYSVENALLAGKVVPVLGRDAASEWIQIEHPARPGWTCWIEASAGIVNGDLGRAPVVPAPEPFVDSVQIDAKPTVLSSADCVFPRAIEVVFWITVNGPAKVTFQRVRDGAYQDFERISFAEAGTEKLVEIYTVNGPGSLSFGVNITSPNEVFESQDSSVSCAS